MQALPVENAHGFLDQALRWTGRTASGQPEWLARMRAEARERLEREGLPTPRREAWRFTPLGALGRMAFDPAEASSEASGAAHRLPPCDECLRVVLVDGIPHLEGGLADGVRVRSLAEVLAAEPERLKDLLGSAVSGTNPFTDLNTAVFTDGLWIDVAPGADVYRPLHVVHVASGRAGVAALPRLLVTVGEAGRLNLVETWVGAEADAFAAPVTEVVVGPAARVDHLRLQEEGAATFHLAESAARLARDARYHSRVVSLGGRLARLDLNVRLEGRGAATDLDGLYLTGGEQLVDHHTVVDHAAPDATSRELYKGILGGASRAVFDGTIVVRPDAQRTSGAQQNRNLLISDAAAVNTKPHLRIDADDVKCSHGATVGQLDADQLFYLRSRGLDRDTARAVLVYAFAREIVDGIADAGLRRYVGAAVLARLPEGGRLEEMA